MKAISRAKQLASSLEPTRVQRQIALSEMPQPKSAPFPLVKRFRRISVPADGHCFYHALRLGLQRSRSFTTTVLELRRVVALYLRAKLQEKALPRDAIIRAAHRAETGQWAEHEEVSASASVFGVEIKVWEGMNNMWVNFAGDPKSAKKPTTQTIYMYNPENLHFDLIVPIAN